jgi:hypothetical protein
MTIRSYTLAMYSGWAPVISPRASREDQLKALAATAHRQFEKALRDGRQRTLRAAGRFLLDCHAMLNHMDEHRVTSPAQTKVQRECELEQQAILAMMQARPDIFEVFCTFRQQIGDGS